MSIFNKQKIVFFMIVLFSSVQTVHAENLYKVKPNDSMDGVSKKFYSTSNLDKFQIYIAILAENPNAFRLGNINYLKSGQTLNLPDASGLLMMEAKDAANLVAEHNDNARKGLKVKIDPPFKDYSPKNSSSKVVSDETNGSLLEDKASANQEELDKLTAETEALRIRLEQLTADKEAMDAELNQLDTLLKQ